MNCSEFLPNINQLANLLKQDEGDSSDDDQPVNATAKLGPASIGPVKQKAPANKAHSDAKKDSKDIWDVDEVEEGAEFEDLDDPRPQPEYDIVYKQAITTEDMFLQIGNKNPTTSSCEDMVVKINLPNTKKSDVDLNVTDKFLDIRSPKFKLGLHLPHPVDSKTGSAKWDADKELLIITLRMKREFDFINQ